MNLSSEGWAIAGTRGLYYGTWLKRRQAIAEHVWCMEGCDNREGWRPLTDQQRAAWKRARKRGDRAVKVRVTAIDQ